MGKCHSSNNKNNKTSNDKATDANQINLNTNNNPNTNGHIEAARTGTVPNRIEKNISLRITDTLGKVLLNQIFSGDTKIKTIADTFAGSLMVNADYDLVHNNSTTIPVSSMQSLESICPNVGNLDLVLSYAGLELPNDVQQSYAETTHLLGSPKFESDPFEIVLYDVSTSNLSYFLYKSMELSELKKFDYFSSYCNGRDKLYISGGDKSAGEETFQDNFIEIDLIKIHKKENHMRKLPNLITGRAWHSMIYVPDHYIFIVGGINTKSVELYNVKTNTISLDSVLNENRSEATLCCINNSELYAFCGFLLHNNFINTIEKCNLKAKTRQWITINITIDEKIVFEPSFFSVALYKENSVLLLGCNEGNKNDSTKNVKTYLFTPTNNDKGLIKLHNTPPLEDLCSEKFFMPVNKKTSLLMPMYASDYVKVLILNEDNLEVSKFEEVLQEETLDELANNFPHKH